MRLLIVSHMPHYVRGDTVVGWGPTAEEIDVIATRFSEVVHVACLHAGVAPTSYEPYRARNVRLVPVEPAGGRGVLAKIGVLRRLPGYAVRIRREMADADVVHVRAPANIALVALLLLHGTRRPAARWIKYAGNWRPESMGAPSFAFQRWLLRRRWHRGFVTVNGRWPGQPRHVLSFDNPCLHASGLADAAASAAGRRLEAPLRVLVVGRLEVAKGIREAIQATALLQRQGVPVRLEFVGDGPERPRWEALAMAQGVEPTTRFHGWVPRSRVTEYYRRAHVVLHPSHSEGWPKVLGEAMAHGVVPVASAVASIPQILEECGAGTVVTPGDVAGFARALRAYAADPDRWRGESARAVEAAPRFTYEHYAKELDILLDRMTPATPGEGARGAGDCP